MSTRTRQTVIESQVVATILSENGEQSCDIRCLCINDRLARFIVTDCVNLDGYQVPILAEASLNLKTNYSSFKNIGLDAKLIEQLKVEVQSIDKDKLLSIAKKKG